MTTTAPASTAAVEMRRALYRLRDAHRETPEQWCARINHDAHDFVPVDAELLRLTEQGERPVPWVAIKWSIVVRRVLRAAELGRLPKATSADLNALSWWLGRHELGLE